MRGISPLAAFRRAEAAEAAIEPAVRKGMVWIANSAIAPLDTRVRELEQGAQAALDDTRLFYAFLDLTFLDRLRWLVTGRAPRVDATFAAQIQLRKTSIATEDSPRGQTAGEPMPGAAVPPSRVDPDQEMP